MTPTEADTPKGAQGVRHGCLLWSLLGVVLLVLPLLFFRDRIMWLVMEDFEEGNVTSRLRGMARSEESFRADRAMDADEDGKGEYGTLAELMGHPLPGRSLAAAGKVNERRAYYDLMGGVLDSAGVWSGHEGWCYVLYLPGSGGAHGAVREVGPAPVLPPGAAVHADGAEVRWWAYGWPRRWGQSGRRAFYADSAGRLLVCANRSARYEASARVPGPGAAFPPGAPADGSIPPVPGASAQDGEEWESVVR